MTATNRSEGLPVRSVPLVGDEPAMRDWAAELVARARAEGVELTGDSGLLTGLVRQVPTTSAMDVTPWRVVARATVATGRHPRR